MGSEGSVGSIRSAGSGQSSEGTNGHSTGLLIENAQVGGGWGALGTRAGPLLLPFPCSHCQFPKQETSPSRLQPLPSAGEDQVPPGLQPASLAGRKGGGGLGGPGEMQVGQPRTWHPCILSP